MYRIVGRAQIHVGLFIVLLQHESRTVSGSIKVKKTQGTKQEKAAAV